MESRKLFQKQILRGLIGSFDPNAYLAAALSRIHQIEGMEMYRVLRSPKTRQQLLAQADRMLRAWRQGERSGCWSAFVRSVDRLKWAWLEMLHDTGGSAGPPADPAASPGPARLRRRPARAAPPAQCAGAIV